MCAPPSPTYPSTLRPRHRRLARLSFTAYLEPIWKFQRERYSDLHHCKNGQSDRMALERSPRATGKPTWRSCGGAHVVVLRKEVKEEED
jgi:hypothetical protein